MAIRNDVELEFNSSPRVIEVADTSTEISMQDLVETLRIAEYTFQGMSFDYLLNASGKEDLGGGVSVGITVALQNLLLAFAGRTTPAETGTVTGTSTSLIIGRQIFEDTAATFQSNNVQRGSMVINFTDRNIADVVSVDSQTELTTKTLVNGITNTYSITDIYHVFNVTQVRAFGGNLTAVDDLAESISAILPTAFTQVVIELSSSATQVETGVSGLTPTESTLLTTIGDTTTTLRKLMMNRMETDPDTGIMTIYDDDDSTVLMSGNIYADVLATQIYRARGLQRRDRLT